MSTDPWAARREVESIAALFGWELRLGVLGDEVPKAAFWACESALVVISLNDKERK